ncbi:MAG: ribonuclease HII [Deltaproteobacteria bacterium]|nr:MAG: ribonuclease HII [Deltaproteobacteria bacterium]
MRRPHDLWAFETRVFESGISAVAGVDEAGRGPLAGPVVSAAVMLIPSFAVAGINDSKKLTPKNRSRLYDKIYQQAVSIGIGIVDALEIDRINILQASLLSMAIAVENLHPQPGFLLIDGSFTIASNLPQQPIPKGDSLSVSIAAASIVAKVTRDRLMEQYDQDYPQFGFSRHKGYPTRAHKEAIIKFGYCPIHRRSFKGVREYL